MSTVTVNGKVFKTFVDKEGVVRFTPSNLIRKLTIRFDIMATHMVQLLELGSITEMDLLEYYAGIGFTVSGVQELSFFENMEFVHNVKKSTK